MTWSSFFMMANKDAHLPAEHARCGVVTFNVDEMPECLPRFPCMSVPNPSSNPPACTLVQTRGHVGSPMQDCYTGGGGKSFARQPACRVARERDTDSEPNSEISFELHKIK